MTTFAEREGIPKRGRPDAECSSPIYPGVELRLYGYAVALAEELGFTHVAPTRIATHFERANPRSRA